CITDGVFRYSRNPLYLGEVLMLLGLAALLGTWQALLPIPVFLAIIQWMFILPEEQLLKNRFDAQYAAYCNRVRRWL
ncbi:MAG: methyltransferase family protein, partial [Opitutales bacterium]